MGVSTKNITGSTLKIIACVCMFIDHFAATVMTYYINSVTGSGSFPSDAILYAYDIMRCIGRIAFPIFCFLMAEGFIHTRSRIKYLRNLAIFALISEIPFDLALYGGNWRYDGYQNVLFTLLLACGFLFVVELIKKGFFEHKAFTPLAYMGCLFGGLIVAYLWPRTYFGQAFSLYAPGKGFGPGAIMGELLACVFAVVYIVKSFTLLRFQKIRDCLCLVALLITIVLADFISCDYGSFGVITVALMYSLNNRNNSVPVKTLFFGVMVLCFVNPLEAFAFLALYPVSKYNHERGLKMKYFFYAFYPAHLLLFYAISQATGLI